MPPGETEGFVYGPADEAYTVSDIPEMKQRIANNPASALMLQPLIDRLEAGDFDTPFKERPPDAPPITDPWTEPKDTDPGEPATTPTETFLNPDGTLKEEYLKQVTEQMGSSPYFQSLMGEQPDLSG